MSAGLYRKQYEALSVIAEAVGVEVTTPEGSFNEKFCKLCQIITEDLGGTFDPVKEGSFSTRKAAYLKEVAVAIGATINPKATTFRELFLHSAKAIWDLNGDGVAPDFGSSLDWRVYQYLHHAVVTNPPAQDELIQWLYDYSGDFELLNKVDPLRVSKPDVVGVNCLSFDGVGQYARTGINVTADTDITIYVDATDGNNFTNMGAVNSGASIRFQLNKRNGAIYRFICGSAASNFIDFDIGSKTWFKMRMVANGDCYIDDVLIGNTGYAITGYIGQFELGASTTAGSSITTYFKAKIALFSGTDGTTTRDIPLSEGNLGFMYDTVTSTALQLGDGSTASKIPTWIQDDNLNTSANLRRGYAKYIEVSPVTTEVAMAEYYDDRLGSFSFTIDDYSDQTADDFVDTLELSRDAGIVTEVAVMTGLCTEVGWSKLQAQIDKGSTTIGSHSKYHRDPDSYPGGSIEEFTWVDLDNDVTESFDDINANLVLPSRHRYNGNNHCTAWHQPWGTALGANSVAYHDRVRSLFLGLGVLSDKSADRDYNNYVAWDATYSTYARAGVSIPSGNNWHVPAMGGWLGSDINNGGTASTYTHPYKYPWTTTPVDPTPDPDYTIVANRGYYDWQIVSNIGGRLDTWYCGLTDLHQYRYLTNQVLPQMSYAEDGAAILHVDGSALDRDKYGLSVPVTYKWTNNTTMDSSKIKCFYAGENDERFSAMTEKTSTEFFNNIECFRRDGDVFYISAALPQTGSKFSVTMREVV